MPSSLPVFDYTAIINQLKAFLQGLLITDLPLVENTGLSYLSATEQRLSELAANVSTGQLTTDDIKTALADEKDIFLSELKSFEVIGLSLTQDAINNAGQVFLGIIQTVFPQP